MKREKDIKNVQNKKRKVIILITITILNVAMLFGVSYAFFKYIKKGDIVSTAITGNLSFSYTENKCNDIEGIRLVDQFPMTDEDGIKQNECGQYFDFNINADTTSAPLNYTVTASIIGETNISTSNIKIYLATVNDSQESQTSSTYFNDEVAVLDDFYNYNDNEKIIYKERITKGNKTYTKKFRLKVWLDENTVIYDNTDSNNIIDNRESNFQIKVTVYAEANIETVMGNATDWIGFINDDNEFEIISPINDFITEYKTSTEILKYFLGLSVDRPSFIHYFKGDLRKELDWFWSNIYEGTEPSETDLVNKMPIFISFIDEDTTNDSDILKYAITNNFVNMNIPSSITIPNVIIYPDGKKYNVKKIGNETLSCVNLKGQEISEYMAINTVTIPEGIEKIGTVGEITSLNDFYLGPFVLCSNLTKVNLPSSIKEIGNLAFGSTGLTTVDIPNGVTKIGASAFSNMKLTELILPESIIEIGQAAFSNNEITNLRFSGQSKLTNISASAFDKNKLTSLFIPASVRAIGRGAFEFNNITSVIFEDSQDNPAQISKLISYVFSSNDLKSITIPHSVTEIGEQALGDNPNLKTIIIKRADATGLILGEYWNHNATVIYQP